MLVAAASENHTFWLIALGMGAVVVVVAATVVGVVLVVVVLVVVVLVVVGGGGGGGGGGALSMRMIFATDGTPVALSRYIM